MNETSTRGIPLAPEGRPASESAQAVHREGGSTLEALRGSAKMLGISATLAWVGGYLDAFTFVGHGHVFANAMTGNVVLLGADAVSGSWRQCLPHILPIVMFLIGIAVARAMCKARNRRWLQSPELSVLWIEIVVFFALGWMPPQTSDFVITMSIAFVASMQMATFRNVNGLPFSSTYTSSNLRTMIENAFDWLFGGRQSNHLSAARDFVTICSMFLFGAIIGAFLTPRLHNAALWVAASVLLLVQIWILRVTRRAAGDR
jgi:uncharacterized membrane protein YoaK (UPF0700 family)